MPPKSARKSAGPGRRGGRTRGTPKVAAQPDPEVVPVPEESIKPVEEEPMEVIEEEKPAEVKEEEVKVGSEKVEASMIEKVNEEKTEKVEAKPVADNGNDGSKREQQQQQQQTDVKDSISVPEFEKDERLDLDDNDPEESEPEEYIGEDYDEKENVEDVQEEVEEIEEEEEEEEVADDDVDVGEDDVEQMEDEVEEPDEHADVVEEQEHHDVFKERRKRKEFEVFVGGLDKDATEEDLRKVFSQVGEVAEVRLMMNGQTKKNKGFAFLRFATVEQAKRACIELKSPVINGKQCGVSPSQDSDTLFLGNVCKTWTKEAVKEKLKKYGVDTVEDLTLVEDNKNEGTNRGFAFLEFSSRSDAMDAFKRLQKRDVTFGVDRPAKVSFADSFIDPGDEIMAQVKTVFIDGLPASWDEGRVRDLLKKYGEVVKIELARNMPSARRKDYGFITFGTHDSALTCAKAINNEELGDGDNKAKVRARLSRPLQRGKGKHVPRGEFRPGRPAPRSFRGSWARPAPRALPPRGTRRVGGGRPPPVVERPVRRPPVAVRDRRPAAPLPPRGRPVAPPPRSYDRRPPVASRPKSSLKREYSRREELPPRSSRAVVADYGPPPPPRTTSERSSSYRDSYPSRGPPAYPPDLPRNSPHPSSRRPAPAYADGGYTPRYERPPPPSYRQRPPRDYDHHHPHPGSKRQYAALDDIPPRYADSEVRHTRVRMDYDMGGGGSSQYGDAYGDSGRIGRSNVGGGGYGSSSRSAMSGHDSHGLYSNSSRQGMSYGSGGGSYGGGDMYSSGYGGEYIPSRGSDGGGGGYSSSLYSGRGGYMGGGGGGGGSGSYY